MTIDVTVPQVFVIATLSVGFLLLSIKWAGHLLRFDEDENVMMYTLYWWLLLMLYSIVY